MIEGLDGSRGDLANRGPRLVHEAPRPAVVQPHQDAARGVVVGMAPVVQVVSVLGRQAVLNPGDRLGAVTRPHLLDAECEDRTVLDRGRHGRQVQRRAATRTRVVDVDDRRLVEAGLAEPALSPHAALVAEPARHGVADDDEAEVVG